jgi:long-chain acyl-CoA synthetase
VGAVHKTLIGFLSDLDARGDETVLSHRPRLRERTWAGRRLAQEANGFARELESRKIAKGDRVLFWGRNSPEWVAAFLGCIQRGVIAVPLDVQSSLDFVKRVREQTEPKLLLCSANLASRYGGLSIPSITLDRLSEVDAAHSDKPLDGERIEEDDLVEIIFTSGTTAEPKGVCITHRNLISNLTALEAYVRPYLKWERLVHPLRLLNVLPLSHIFGQLTGIFVPQLIRAEVHFHESLNPTDVIDTIRRYRINALVTIPRLLDSLREKLERQWSEQNLTATREAALRSSDDWHFLKRWLVFRDVHRQFGWRLWAFVSGGATLGRDTEDFWSRLGYLVVQGYGMTETASLISYNEPFSVTRGSIGRTLPGQEVRVDESGEILIRGPNISPGYWKRGVEPMVGEQGWFRTGDIGELDQQGNLYFKGRKKDVIATAAGLKVFPEDIEAALNRQPNVRDSAVIGFEGPRGPEPLAVLLLRNQTGEPQSIVDRANRELAEYQQVRRWLVWPEPDFPRTTTTRKIRKRDLVEALRLELPGKSPSIKPATVASAIARISGAIESGLQPSAGLTPDLKLDSVGRVELLSALEDRYQVELDEAAFTSATTVADVEKMIRESAPLGARPYPYPEWPQRLPAKLTRFLALYLIVLPVIRLLGWPRVRGRQHLDALSGPVLFVCNHITAIDPALVIAALPAHFRNKIAIAMIGEWLRDWRYPPEGTGWFKRLRWRIEYALVLCLFNAFSLPQESGFRRSFSFAGWLMDSGFNLLVFPEGQRTQDGRLNPFMRGIGVMTAGLGVPVVPIRIDGLFELKQRRRFFALPGEIRVTFGEPYTYVEGASPADVTSELEKRVEMLATGTS